MWAVHQKNKIDYLPFAATICRSSQFYATYLWITSSPTFIRRHSFKYTEREEEREKIQRYFHRWKLLFFLVANESDLFISRKLHLKLHKCNISSHQSKYFKTKYIRAHTQTLKYLRNTSIEVIMGRESSHATNQWYRAFFGIKFNSS